MSSLISQINSPRQVDGCLTPTSDNQGSTAIAKRAVGTFSRDVAYTPSTLSIVSPKSSEVRSNSPESSPMDTIPSPPMSPNIHVVETETARFGELLFPNAIRAKPVDIASIEQSVGSAAPARVVGPAFPTPNLVAAPLYINPFHDLHKGYRKRQFSFLAHYKLTQDKPVVHAPSRSPRRSPSAKTYNTVSRTRYATPDATRPRTRRHARASSDEASSDDSVATDVSFEPVKKRRRRKQTTRKANSATTRYDYDYTKLADYCPSLDTLPDNARCMKTEWKGQSMDLFDDPLAGELHSAELQLASTLRLPCNVYLDSKRRIFAEKVKRMRSNLPFRRTDAQKACKIDVNKASRLYAAFEKVGWLTESNFHQFL